MLTNFLRNPWIVWPLVISLASIVIVRRLTASERTTLLLSLAGVAVCAAFVGLLLGIELDLNIFDWVGKWHRQSMVCITGIPILIVAIYFLASATKNARVSVVAVVSC